MKGQNSFTMFWERHDRFIMGDPDTSRDDQPVYRPIRSLKDYSTARGIPLVPDQVPLGLVLDRLGAARWEARGLERLYDVETTKAIVRLRAAGFGFVVSDHVTIIRNADDAPEVGAIEVRNAGGHGWYMTDCAATLALRRYAQP